jgi:beta-glucosidase
VPLAVGETRTARFGLHADLTSYTGAGGGRIVEEGAVELRVAASSADVRFTLAVELTGPRRSVGPQRVLAPTVAVE